MKDHLRRICLTLAVIAVALVAILLTGCSTPSDQTFMKTAALRILPGDGVVQDANGRMMMSRGLDNHNRPHPFFGNP